MFKNFPRTFWVANLVELFERWAWYGLFMVLALYLTGSPDSGALGFTQTQKGLLMGSVVGILYFLPVLTGSIADNLGYKKTLLISLTVYATGYVLLSLVKSFFLFYMVFLYVAIGSALFKPIVSATVQKTTNKETVSVGFGIFYMIVNIGAFLGPIFSSKLRGLGWSYVFYMAAALSVFNLLLVLFFYKEPAKENSSKVKLGELFKLVFKNFAEVLKDKRLLIFLLLIVSFWTIYNQLFFALPVFIEQWVNTHPLYELLSKISVGFASAVGTPHGTIEPEMITNLDAGFIILFQVIISSIVKKMYPVKTIMTGIFIATLGITLTFVTANIFYLILGIFIFSIGEMSSSPKVTEYIASLAPPDKTALYVGTSFIPLSLGNFLAGFISGNYYQAVADKVTIMKKELVSLGVNASQLKDLSSTKISDMLIQMKGMDKWQLTSYLWDKYHPYNYWIALFSIGMFAVVSLWVYYKFLIKR